MGDMRIVQLPKLAQPLAPGTVAFSVAPGGSCEHKLHHQNPRSLLRITGVAQANGIVGIDPTGKKYTYQSLWDRYKLFKVKPHAITELDADHTLDEGGFVAGFAACGIVSPFMLTTPAWLTADGIQAYRTDINPFGSRLCFTTNPKGWLVVEAGWNSPLDLAQIVTGQDVVVYDYGDNKTTTRTAGVCYADYISFAGGQGGLSIEAIGESHWLFEWARLPRVAK